MLLQTGAVFFAPSVSSGSARYNELDNEQNYQNKCHPIAP